MSREDVSSRMIMRLATKDDVNDVGNLYDLITLYQNEHGNYTSWQHKKYPSLAHAEESFVKGTLFIFLDEGELIGSVVLDHDAHPAYKDGSWAHPLASPQEALIVHRLVLSPLYLRKGYGAKMMETVLSYARQEGFPTVRLDTTVKNLPAKGLYDKIGFKKSGVTTLDFTDRDSVEVQLYEYIL